MVKFKANGYELNRNSENKVFTHAVIFENISEAVFVGGNIGAKFHISLKKAEADAKNINKHWHIKIIEIVEVSKVGA